MPAPSTHDENARPVVLTTASDADTARLGERLGALARPNDVIALSGGLGAGKTCLAQGIARGLGVAGPVPSPTFNILLVHAAAVPMHHFDLYRLEHADQLEDIDFYGTLEADGVSVIEWADRFPDEMPAERLDVLLEVVSDAQRRVTVTPFGARAAELADALARPAGEIGAS